MCGKTKIRINLKPEFDHVFLINTPAVARRLHALIDNSITLFSHTYGLERFILRKEVQVSSFTKMDPQEWMRELDTLSEVFNSERRIRTQTVQEQDSFW